MSKKNEIVERIEFPELELRLVHEYAATDHFDADQHARFYVSCLRPAGNTEIAGIAEFCALLATIGAARLQHHSAPALAHMASVLLETGRLVVPGPLYEALAAQFNLDLAQQAPRLRDGHLFFLAVKVDLDTATTVLNRVDMDLDAPVPTVHIQPVKERQHGAARP